MKLAEALVERKAAQQKLAELNERLQRVAIVQEGDQPAESPTALLREHSEVAARLEQLIIAINQTNTQTTIADGRSLTQAIAHRDVLRMRQGVLDTLLRSVGSPQYRSRGNEIKFVATVSVSDLQRERDSLAKSYRELDAAIQSINWTADLIES